MAGYVMKMSILVPNINHRGQKDFSFEVRHKVYARPLPAMLTQESHYEKNATFFTHCFFD
ncbi:MAG: hypothetical protein Q8O88_02665 [bacterium]|nr:hypothetical protein [bacterium]